MALHTLEIHCSNFATSFCQITHDNEGKCGVKNLLKKICYRFLKPLNFSIQLFTTKTCKKLADVFREYINRAIAWNRLVSLKLQFSSPIFLWVVWSWTYKISSELDRFTSLFRITLRSAIITMLHVTCVARMFWNWNCATINWISVPKEWKRATSASNSIELVEKR